MIYLQLFLNFLMIGALSFGGGYGMISLVREVVLCDGGLTESDFLSFIAVSESTPGPLAVNMATFIGSSQAGLPGALVATLGVVLPSFVIILLVAAVLRSQTGARKEAEYSARITEKPDGHCSIRCTIKALDQELLCLDIGTPDRLSADLVKKQFILKGNEIYQMLITKLTE